MSEQEQLIAELFKKGILVSKDVLEKKIAPEVVGMMELEEDLLVINSDYTEIVGQQTTLVDWYEVDKSRVEAEKERDDELYQTQLQSFRKSTLSLDNSSSAQFTLPQQVTSWETELNSSQIETSFSVNLPAFSSDSPLRLSAEESALSTIPLTDLTVLSQSSPVGTSVGTVTVLVSYENVPHKYEVKDFTNFFVSRYRYLEKILYSHPELEGTLPISRILTKKEKEPVSLIGIIENISVTKNNNLIVTIEDLTGRVNLIISKNKSELYALGKDLVVDEIIGIVGTHSDQVIFVEKIISPDLPTDCELKKNSSLEEEEYALFLSDLHVGSTLFLNEEFEKFLRWINGKIGSDSQKEIARKVKYIFITGDLVDGIGVYPSQEDELLINDISLQYREAARLLAQIPSHKQIIACPGNHDLIHLAEPQPVFYKEYCSELSKLPNLILVSNPAVVNIGKSHSFSGFEILMYHGYSFDYYVANVESIRNNGGYNRGDLIMKFLLQKRHLAPSFKSTPYHPCHSEDPFLIKKIPDFFITGHIHYSNVANYKGVTMISGSCWQSKTSFQEKMGHEPEPGRVPLVNLKTREIKILKFVEKDDQKDDRKDDKRVNHPQEK